MDGEPARALALDLLALGRGGGQLERLGQLEGGRRVLRRLQPPLADGVVARGSSLVSWVRSASIRTDSTVSPATCMVPVTAVERPTASFGLDRGELLLTR